MIAQKLRRVWRTVLWTSRYKAKSRVTVTGANGKEYLLKVVIEETRKNLVYEVDIDRRIGEIIQLRIIGSDGKICLTEVQNVVGVYLYKGDRLTLTRTKMIEERIKEKTNQDS